MYPPLRPLTPSFFLALGVLLAAALPAQRIDYRPGELLVRLAEGRGPKSLHHPDVVRWEALGGALNCYRVFFDHGAKSGRELRAELWRDPAVAQVQINHLVERRARPDDQRYAELYYFRNTGQGGGAAGADYRVESAWDVTTGGRTPDGADIVVAIVDNGIDRDHPDIASNLWINPDEVAGNGVDDDNNGYVDDVHGWNTRAESGDVEDDGGDHGTSVASVVGAVGNNGIGVTGVNWRVKLMILADRFFHTSEADVLAAHSYVLEQRRAYAASGGRRGAYVVAVNNSFGVPNGLPEDSPIWCELYDTLGEAGILSAGAAPNEGIDVDVMGDIPTRCPSDYLIGVTSLNASDERVAAAGFGATSVDLGGYGHDVLAADLGATYQRRTGTSFATPAVAGAVALLHAAPCPSWNQLASNDPAAAARYLRSILLTTTRANASLGDQTTTGGVLNIGAAMAELMRRCGDCLAPTSPRLTADPAGSTDLIAAWNTIDRVTDVTLRYRRRGAGEWTEAAGVTSPYVITGLDECTVYEAQLLGRCGAGGAPQSSVTVTGETNGCCRPPTEVTLTPRAGQDILIGFTPQLGERRHRVRFRPVGAAAWDSRLVIGQNLILPELAECVEYEVQVATLCAGGTLSDYGPVARAFSFGCGACNEKSYCRPSGQRNDGEWIALVNLGNLLINPSDAEVGAYEDFGALTRATFVRGGTYPLTVAAGPEDLSFSQVFRAWVDWNQDGRFTEEEVIVDDAATATDPDGGQAPLEIAVTVPEDATPGLTRLRVSMEYLSHRGNPCSVGGGKEGEVEDYCVEVAPAPGGCPAPPDLTATFDAATGDTRLSWPASAAPGGGYRLRYRRLGEQDFISQRVTGLEFTVPDLDLCGTYEVEIASDCPGGAGGFRRFTFNDLCVGTNAPALAAADWSVFPNPAGARTRVSWAAGLPVVAVSVYGADGRRLLRRDRPGGRGLDLDVGALPAGVYLVRLTAADGRAGVRKLLRR